MAEKLISRGEVYWINLLLSNGRELQDKHPGVVISNDEQNKYSPLITILPITSLKRSEKPYPFQVASCLQDKKGVILIDQIRTVDRKRLGDKLGKLSMEEMERVEKSLHITLALKN